ncbi:MAG: hypothetical protein OSJ70_04865 [Bacilli bacterium]|nr:hypothetical protein [Bacilli bacterium]
MNKKLRILMQDFKIKDKLRFLQAEVLDLNIAIVEQEEKKINPVEFVKKFICNLSAIMNNTSPEEDLKEIKESIAEIETALREIRLYYRIPSKEISKIMNSNINEKIELYEKAKKLKEEVNSNEKI